MVLYTGKFLLKRLKYKEKNVFIIPDVGLYKSIYGKWVTKILFLNSVVNEKKLWKALVCKY